jgi:hypothetical protein
MPSTPTSLKALLLAAAYAGFCVIATACGTGDSSFGAKDASDGPTFITSDGGVEAAPVACVDSVQAANLLPVDLVFLLERSQLVLGIEWDSLTHAVLDYVNQGFRSPTQIALNFFPYAVAEDVYGDQIGTNVDFCQYRVYEDLVVPLGPVTSQLGPVEAAIAAGVVGEQGFGFEAPYYAALKGTYFAATKAQDAHPDHQVVVVVIGQGTATACPAYGPAATDPGAIAGLAASALNYDGVRTFAITFTGVGFSNMNAITTAGGGVVYNTLGNTQQDLLDALNQVTKSATQCTFALPAAPPGQTLDTSRVGVQVTSSSGDRTTVPETNQENCGQGAGWYYDNAAQPGKVILCPASCDAVKADPVARVELIVACSSGAR